MNNMHEILNNQKKFYLENGAPSYLSLIHI